MRIASPEIRKGAVEGSLSGKATPQQLAALVEDQPDLTLEEIRETLSEKGSLMAAHGELKRLGFRFKKTLKASEQEREDMTESRENGLSSRRLYQLIRLFFWMNPAQRPI
ncbi:MAG: hypothetical protein V3571_09440 [Pseudodesulfovibrio sp.]